MGGERQSEWTGKGSSGSVSKLYLCIPSEEWPCRAEAEAESVARGSSLTAGLIVHDVHAALLPRPPPAVGRLQDTLVVVCEAVGATHRLVLLGTLLAAPAAQGLKHRVCGRTQVVGKGD